MRYLFGFFAIAVGFLIIWKSEWMLVNFGRIDWAEQHIGSDGGTRIFYKLLGVCIILIAFLIMGGFIEGILLAIFAPTLRTQ